MKKLFIFFLMIFALPVSAAEFLDKNIAVVRVLDKASGRSKTVELRVGQNYEIDKLNVLVRSCKQSAPFEPQNNFMFAEIKSEDKIIFSNWQNSANPSDNPLMNADYDLWILECK